MFKRAQILRRSFSLFRRVPNSDLVRAASHESHKTIQIQRVRFKKPFFTRSRLIGTAAVTAGLYGVLQFVDVEIIEEEVEGQDRIRQPRRQDGNQVVHGQEEADELDDDDEEGDEREADADDEDNALLFFPTGFSRPKPRSFYRGSDPEWQEFVRIAPDQKRLKDIQRELIWIIRNLAVRSPDYNRRLGKVDPKKGGVWLEFKFPDGPPLEYERPGIEITDHLEVRRSTRPVEAIHHQRLKNILFPAGVANLLYADTRRKLSRQWQEFGRYLGWEENRGQRDGQIVTSSPQNSQGMPPTQLHPAVQRPSPTPQDPSQLPSGTPPSETADAQSPQKGSSQTTSKEPESSPLRNPAYERFGIALPNPTALTLDLSTFRQAVRKEFKGHKMEPPRGTFLVSGLIEVVGTRARMTLDVTGTYDPQTAQYVMVRASLRSLTDFRQTPKGGP